MLPVLRVCPTLLAHQCLCLLLLLLLSPALVFAHTVITYPGIRGDNLQTNGSIENATGLGVGNDNTYPFGMQWIYPCGGMPMSFNRTKWPVTGGAVGLQPGWFSGHSSALIYINLGDGNNPKNYSLIMQPMFGITGPNNVIYNGSICLPQVPLPANYTAVIGQNATIQVIEAAQHGAALFNVSWASTNAYASRMLTDCSLKCVDITFADPKDVPEVTPENCANSSDIGFDFVYSTSSLNSGSSETRLSRRKLWLASISFFVAVIWTTS